MAAVVAAYSQAAVGQDAVRNEGIEPILYELRRGRVGSIFWLTQESRVALLHPALRRGLFRVVALVVNSGAAWRQLGLPRW